MKFTITKPVEIDIKYLDVFVGGRAYPEDMCINYDDEEFEEWDEIFEKYPTLKGNNGYEAQLYLRINVETGHVDNWPSNTRGGCFRTLKIVDEGIYILRDNNLNEIKKYEGYVPDCLEIEEEGYGDYWEFNVNENGFIENWKFTQDDVNQLFEIDDEE